MASLFSLIPPVPVSTNASLTDSLNEREIRAWAPILGSGALVLLGLSRRSLVGLLMASVGGVFLYRAVAPRPTTMRTGATLTISRSPQELYTYWRELKNLPRIMDNLVSVTEISDKRSHWTAKTVGGINVEWDAEIVDEEPNRYIAWQSDRDAEIQTHGVVRFERAPGDRGTEVHLTLEYSLPAGLAGAANLAMLGADPSQQARQDLQRFKQYMETGVIATTDGQPAGDRGLAPDVETVAGVVNNVLEGLNVIRTGGKATRGRAGTRA